MLRTIFTLDQRCLHQANGGKQLEIVLKIIGLENGIHGGSAEGGLHQEKREGHRHRRTDGNRQVVVDFKRK